MSQQPTVRLVNITLLNFLARIIFYVFVFAAGWYTARMLPKEEFGQLQFVTFSAGLSWTLLSLGMPNMLSRYMTQSVVAKSKAAVFTLLTYTAWAFIISLVAICAGIILFFGTRTLNISAELIIVFIVSQFLANYFQILIQSVYHYKTAFSVTLIAVLAGSILLYLMLPVWHSSAYIYSLIAVNVILVVGYGSSFLTAIKKLDGGVYELPARNKLLRTAFYFALSAILAGILWQRTEFYLLEKWLSFTDIAVYSVAFTLIALFFEPLKLLTGVLTYYFAGIEKHEDQGERQFAVYFKHFCWLVIFIGTFVWFNAPAIVHHIYTDKYAEAAIYLRLLLIGMVPGVCSYVLMSVHIGMGRSRFLLIQDTVCAFIFCVTVFFFTQWKGLEGTAIAKSVTIMISVAIGLTYTAVRINFAIPWKLPLFSLVLAIVLGYATQSFLTASLVLLAIKFAFMFVIYLAVSYFSNMMDRPLITRVRDELFKFLGMGSA
jgi:O-antigen/teichoic acid export membrane protein